MSAPKDPIRKAEWKRGISETHKGKKSSEETKRKISESLKGITRSEETKRKMAISKLGDKNPMKRPEISRKVAESNRGRVISQRTRDKLRIAHKGNILSEEHRRKISESRKGIVFSKEHCENISKSKKGSIPWNKGKIWLELSGENHPNWQGGKSFEPYGLDFNKRFKESIRMRDNYTCQLCNLFEDDAIKLYGYRLLTHHIDYDKKNSFPQNSIALCTRCHSIVNFNRVHWTLFFQSLLKEKYGYEYTEDQKIILDFCRNDKNEI